MEVMVFQRVGLTMPIRYSLLPVEVLAVTPGRLEDQLPRGIDTALGEFKFCGMGYRNVPLYRLEKQGNLDYLLYWFEDPAEFDEEQYDDESSLPVTERDYDAP